MIVHVRMITIMVTTKNDVDVIVAIKKNKHDNRNLL